MDRELLWGASLAQSTGWVKSCVKQVPPRYTLPRLPSTPYCFTIFALEILPRGGIVG